jgi:hypothetical protein
MDRQQFEQKQERQQARLRAFYDYGMGILWLGAGIFFLGYQQFGMELDFDPLLSSIFGGACVLYGLFRIWRGYRVGR